MLSQPNLRSCSLRLRRAQGGRQRTRGKKRTRERGREKRIKASKKDTKEATPKMSIKAKRVKSSQARTKEEKEQQRAGVVESTTEVTIRKKQNDTERANRAFKKKRKEIVPRSS